MRRVAACLTIMLPAYQPSRAPRFDPLSYPGVWPLESALISDRPVLGLHHRASHGWVTLSGEPLDAILADRGEPLLGDREPVLAVGSNAAPAQLRAKFAGTPFTIPSMVAHVTGVGAGFSARVSSYGVIPATAVAIPGTHRLFVQWLTESQLAAVDSTELRNYDRIWVDDGIAEITVAGHKLEGAWAYADKGAHLTDVDGTPWQLNSRRFPDQASVIRELLSAHPELRQVVGFTPEEFAAGASANLATVNRILASR